ncbi:MAG: response regulator [Anaerolineae bacterium]|jgi:DNA-binding response OmpR family regulator|nr:response regulator [Anaerolineae bacterium]
MSEHKSKTILYIEDDPEMIDLAKVILTRHGFEVKGAHGGRHGLDILAEQPVDVILLDLMMPDVDGWEVFQQLKSNKATENIPVIVVTARSQPIDRVLGLHIAKVDDYVCKPFRPQELVESINKLFQKKPTQST